MDSGDESTIPSYQTIDLIGQPLPLPERQAGRAELATRLVIGLLVSGSGELLQRLEELQEEILADPGLARRGASAKVDTTRDELRYLAISLLLRGERRVTGSIRTGLDQSKAAMRWTVRALDRLTDNRLMRPVRRPVGKRARNWADQLALLIEEGKREEQNSKLLTGESISLIIDDVVDLVADNPELDRLVAELIGQKSIGLATVAADNARTLTATGDYLAEGLLRRLLRRTPRRLLPPSPIEGQPQTMYWPETRAEGGDTNG